MFEGKEGIRIFKREEDAETAIEVNSRNEEAKLKKQKVRVSDGELAKKVGISTHLDLSIAARPPRKGETGWIVTEEKEKVPERFRKALEFLNE